MSINMLGTKTYLMLVTAANAFALPHANSPWDDHLSAGFATSATASMMSGTYIATLYRGDGTAAATPTAVTDPSSILTASIEPSAVSATSSAMPSTSVVSSSGSQSDYIGTVNVWRAQLGLSDLTQSDILQSNALKTVQDGNGQMVHELHSGSFAQVLAPGSADEFEKVFVGGWLCERPDLPGLDGVCTTMSQGWAYDGQTGHADILTSDSYSQIGCAQAVGIWGCDLA